MRRILVPLALIAIFAVAGAHAWWCTGHMVIAEIARKNLNSGVEAAVNQQFNFLNTWFDKATDMVAGACWADDLKSDRLRAMADWHFINQVYNPENYNIALGDWPIQKENVEAQIEGLQRTVHDESSNAWIMAFATANLIHFYGDIHQPLHATDKFSATYPQGDRGGNLINVVLNGTTMVLHAVWDSVCGQYTTDPYRPLSSGARSFISYLADSYISNFTVSSETASVYNSTVMALESFEAAVQYSYDNNNIHEGAVLSASYISNCMQVAGLRITTAGLRLANELNYLYGNSNSGESANVRARKILKRVVSAQKEVDAALLSKKQH